MLFMLIFLPVLQSIAGIFIFTANFLYFCCKFGKST